MTDSVASLDTMPGGPGWFSSQLPRVCLSTYLCSGPRGWTSFSFTAAPSVQCCVFKNVLFSDGSLGPSLREDAILAWVISRSPWDLDVELGIGICEPPSQGSH